MILSAIDIVNKDKGTFSKYKISEKQIREMIKLSKIMISNYGYINFEDFFEISNF